MKKFLFAVVVILCGCCAKLKVPKINTNKADKIISFHYSVQASPFGYVGTLSRDLNIAKEICISWGYKDAKLLEKNVSKCLGGCCDTKQIINYYVFALVAFHTHNFYCQTKDVVNSYKCI